MAAPAKWTLDSFGDDPEVQEDLPKPVEVTRASLSDPDFDVEAFLNTHSQYRTLRDTQYAVRVWEEKLHAELIGVMNENFRDFVGAATSLGAGKPLLESMHADVGKFEKLAARVAKSLEANSDALERELLHHKRLSSEEGEARKLLFMFDLLEELEAALHEVETREPDSLESLARAYVAIIAVAEDLHDVKAVNLMKVTVQGLQRDLLETLSNAIAAAGPGEDKMRLVEARAWVHASTLA